MSKMKLIMENWKKFIKEEETQFPPMQPRADMPGTHPDELDGEPLLKSLTPRVDAPSNENSPPQQLFSFMMEELAALSGEPYAELVKIFSYQIHTGQKGYYFQLDFGRKGNEILNNLGTRKFHEFKNLPFSGRVAIRSGMPDLDPEGYSSQFDGTKGYWSYKYKQ